LWNAAIQYSLGDDPPTTTSYFQLVHFQGDTLYLTIGNSTVNQINIYKIKDNSFELLQTIHIPGVVKVVSIQGNLLYVTTESISSGYFGPGPLSIYSIGANWSLTPVLQNYTPGGYDIFTSKVDGNQAYMWDGGTLYRVNIANPSAPAVMKQIAINCTGYIRFTDSYIAYLSNDVSNISSIILRDLTTLDVLQTWKQTRNITSFDFSGTNLLISYHDTLDVYDISNLSTPVKIGSTYSLSPLSWIDSRYDLSYIQSLGNNLVAMRGGAGSVVYNINTPSIPRYVASFYSGPSKNIISINGAYFAVPPELRSIRGFAESSINRIQLTNPEYTYNEVSIPLKFSLEQNYPNPFNPTTKIRFVIPESGPANLRVFDILGNQVAVPFNNTVQAGSYEIEFNGNHLASGVYFYRLTTGKYTDTKKLILMK
jgi:hypothetical protein